MKTRNILIPAIAVLALTVASCKPTEAGYKAAYDAALAKRTVEQDDAAAFGGMTRQDGPGWRLVGSDSVLFIQQPLAPLDGDTLPVKDINVAIALYKMTANADAHAKRLADKGLDSRVLKARGNSYLVIAAQFDSLAQTVPFIETYVKTHPNDMYSGLPGRPVVTAPSSRHIH